VGAKPPPLPPNHQSPPSHPPKKPPKKETIIFLPQPKTQTQKTKPSYQTRPYNRTHETRPYIYPLRFNVQPTKQTNPNKATSRQPPTIVCTDHARTNTHYKQT